MKILKWDKSHPCSQSKFHFQNALLLIELQLSLLVNEIETEVKT